MPEPNFDAERRRLTSDSSMAGQVAQWLRIRASDSMREAHSSYICDGASTKSRSTLGPECWLYSVFDSTPCSTWPNSWKNVSTSLCVSPCRLKLVTSAEIGLRAARVDTPRTGHAAACLYLSARG